MEMQRELDVLPLLSPEARRKAEHDAFLVSIGVRPATSSEPRPDFIPVRTSLLTRLRARFMR